MSAEIIIIPVALAFVAFKAARELRQSDQATEQDVYAWRVSTVIADKPLLMAALKDLGIDAQWSGDTASMVVGGWSVGLVKEDGRYAVLLQTGITQDEAMRFAVDLEKAYTRCVQAAVLTRIQVQAPEMGMRVADVRRNQDASVTLTLEVNQA